MNRALCLCGPLYCLLTIAGGGQLCADDEAQHAEFLARLQAEEPYIGFFAAEEKCITDVSPGYLEARRKFFLGIRDCREDTEAFIEPFVAFCRQDGLLASSCEKEWQRVLVILSHELYANMPIFEFQAANLRAHRGLVFAEYPNKKLHLDLFLPAKPAATPVPCVVCIHGGGWRVNRRVWFEPFAQYLAAQGLAAVTIDYRMLPAVKVIDCVHDAKAAVRWVRANADRYGIDPQRIGALGASAGAHLAALLATTADHPALEGTGGHAEHSSAIQAAVGIATPALKMNEAGAARAARFGISSEDLKLISPYEHISAASAPLFLIHGTADRVVAPGDAQALYDRYTEMGGEVQVKWIEGEGHGFYEGTDAGIALAAPFFLQKLVHGP